MFGDDVTGSTGTLFLYGIVVVAIGMLGLSMLLAGARRTARRGRQARSELKQSRRETAIVSQDRDHLLHERETDHADQEAEGPLTAAPNGDGKTSPGTGESPPAQAHLGKFRHAAQAAAIRPVRNPSSAICLLKLRGQGLHSAEGGESRWRPAVGE